MGLSGGIKKKKGGKKKKLSSQQVQEMQRVVPTLTGGMVKHLRACISCKLVKTEGQFDEEGCSNCNWDLADYTDETTPDFTGMIAMMEPEDSWVAKWQRMAKYRPGVYAKSVKAR